MENTGSFKKTDEINPVRAERVENEGKESC